MNFSGENLPDTVNKIKRMCFIVLKNNTLLDVLNKLDHQIYEVK